MADKNKSNGKVKVGDVARRAREQLQELTGRRVEGVSGIERGEDDTWQVTVEVLELERVPNSTDLLGSYALALDADGDLLEYRRTARYARGQADEGGR